MNKEEWIWVAIRVFGIYLVVLGAISIPGLVSSISSLMLIPDFIGDTTQMSEEMKFFYSMAEQQKSNVIKYASQLLIFSSIGLYFLKGGKFIHALIAK